MEPPPAAVRSRCCPSGTCAHVGRQARAVQATSFLLSQLHPAAAGLLAGAPPTAGTHQYLLKSRKGIKGPFPAAFAVNCPHASFPFPFPAAARGLRPHAGHRVFVPGPAQGRSSSTWSPPTVLLPPTTTQRAPPSNCRASNEAERHRVLQPPSSAAAPACSPCSSAPHVGDTTCFSLPESSTAPLPPACPRSLSARAKRQPRG